MVMGVQCYAIATCCDGNNDCVNRDDELGCMTDELCEGRYLSPHHPPPPAPPAVVEFIKGCHTIYPLNQTGVQEPILCPETHYQCPKGYCLPVFTRCNGVYDCPEWEDEAGCEDCQCPGYYRCRGSSSCLHHSHVCDGIHQCPQSDDELLCGQKCPGGCTCYGLAFTCPRWFSADQHPDLRYLKARGSGMKMEQLTLNAMLVYLNLASCQVFDVGTISFRNMVTLDLSDNHITSLTSVFQGMVNLRTLVLSNNPLSGFLYADSSLHKESHGSPVVILSQIQVLHMAAIYLPTIKDRLGKLFPHVQKLNVSGCGTQRVAASTLQLMTQLQTLDMTGCPMEDIQENVFKDLARLEKVYGDNYKLCCNAALLEGFNVNNCHAPKDAISSCDDLLQSNVYRAMLALFTSLSILGNLVSGVFRSMTIKRKGSTGFGVFVVHLCASDFLMGLYLAVIGAADRLYHNVYVWKDVSWRHGRVCQSAGFISLLSSEVSSFIICLITLDRFLIVHFPLKFLRFKSTQAHLATAGCWLIGILLAFVPFFPGHDHWDFYSQTGICIPLPVTTKQFAGQRYAFAVMIVLNFILFLFIALGQVIILYSVRTNQMSATQTGHSSQDADLARRLFTIAVSDFLCWFPIGLLGLLASQGVSVSGEVNVAMAILVLPLNSAINPFLYTLNVLMEKRRRVQEDRLLKHIQTLDRTAE